MLFEPPLRPQICQTAHLLPSHERDLQIRRPVLFRVKTATIHISGTPKQQVVNELHLLNPGCNWMGALPENGLAGRFDPLELSSGE